MGSEIIQRWDDLLKSYSLLKENLTVLYQNGYSFGKILHISRVDKIFLCAVFFKNGSYDTQADAIINNFDEYERSQFTQYGKLFEFIEEEEEKKKTGEVKNDTVKYHGFIELDDEDGEKSNEKDDEVETLPPPLPPPPAPATTRSQKKQVQFNEVNEIREFKQENSPAYKTEAEEKEKEGEDVKGVVVEEEEADEEEEDIKSDSDDGGEGKEGDTSETNIKVEPIEEPKKEEEIIESIETKEKEDNVSNEDKVEDVKGEVDTRPEAEVEAGTKTEVETAVPEPINALVRTREPDSEDEKEEEIARKRMKLDTANGDSGSSKDDKIEDKIENSKVKTPLLDIIPGYKDLSAEDLRFRDFKENKEKYEGEDGHKMLRKIEFTDSEDVLLVDKVEEIMKSVRMKIQKYIVLLLKVEADGMEDVLEQRYVEKEMDAALGLLREYGADGAVGRAVAALRAGVRGVRGVPTVSAGDVFVRVNCDNERLRFKVYELGSRVQRAQRQDQDGGEALAVAVVGGENSQNSRDEAAEELREQVGAVVEVVQRAAAGGDGELLRAARRAAARLSRACEEHLSGVLESLERAQLVCEAAADATALAAGAGAGAASEGSEGGEGEQRSAEEESDE